MSAKLILLLVFALFREENAQFSVSSDATKDFLEPLNDFRKGVAQINGQNGQVPGSEALFGLEADAALSASAVFNTLMCKNMNTFPYGGASINYYTALAPNPALQTTQLVGNSINEWRLPAVLYGLGSDAVYKDQRLQSFANMAYYKSVRVGCAVNNCAASGQMPTLQVAACVFDSAPVLNSPLYTPSTEKNPACNDTLCALLLPGSGCGNSTVPPDGLCSAETTFPTDAPSTIPTTLPATVPSSIASTASSVAASTSQSSASPTTTTTTTTPAPTTTGPIAQETRDRVVAVHNNRRYLLANGRVVNGLTKTNCGTARNIFAMRYDLGLEIDAQNYANQCPTNENGSPVSSRPTQGENVKIIYSNSIPFYYAVDSAVQSWWDQIAINGINAKMLFTDFLQTKPLAPIKFTQMAWAASYRVGCGAQRCGGTTVVVCRYSPRGNIVGEHIYNVGTVCGDCINSCTSEGLCTPPTRS